MKETKYYYCKICGNIVEKICDSGVPVECCNQTMVELLAGVTDGAVETHVPMFSVDDNCVEVRVGKNPHPMVGDHYIEWIEMTTDKGLARKYLTPGDEPIAHFVLCDGEKLISVAAYCNKHKLWKAVL